MAGDGEDGEGDRRPTSKNRRFGRLRSKLFGQLDGGKVGIAVGRGGDETEVDRQAVLGGETAEALGSVAKAALVVKTREIVDVRDVLRGVPEALALDRATDGAGERRAIDPLVEQVVLGALANQAEG